MAEEKTKVVARKPKKDPTIPQVQAVILKSGRFLWHENMKQVGQVLKDEIISRQLESEEFDYNIDNVYKPPFEPEALIKCLELSTIHYRCVKAKAFDVAGGYFIRAVEGVEKPDEKQKEELEEFFDTCGGTESYLEILERTLIDFESVGYGGIEIGRNRKGKPASLWHIPAATLRLLKDGQRILQRRELAKVYFQIFPNKFDLETGKWKLIDPATGRVAGNTDALDAANEILMFVNYHPRSERYGEPDFIPATGAIAGNIYARDFNLDDFAESMIPAYAVLVSGGTVGKETQALIEQYFEDVRASGRNVLVISVPGKNVKIELKELQSTIKDASFTTYKKDNRDELLLAHGMHPARIGIIETATLGSGSGMSQLVHYKSGVVEPRQRWVEHKINYLIVRRGFGITDWEYAFVDLDIADKKEEADILTKYVTAGIMDENEARVKIGLPEREKPKETEGPDYLMSLKTAGSHIKAEMLRKQFAAGLRASWEKARIPKPEVVKQEGEQPKFDPPPIEPIKDQVHDRLMTVADMMFPTAISELSEEVAKEWGIEYDPEDLDDIESEIRGTYEDYIKTAWLHDFELNLKDAYGLRDEEAMLAAIEKTKRHMRSRAGLYAGLMFTVLALLAARAATKKGALVYWKIAGGDACPDCIELAAKSPYRPGGLAQFPGDGQTQCRGNCRCVLVEAQ